MTAVHDDVRVQMREMAGNSVASPHDGSYRIDSASALLCSVAALSALSLLLVQRRSHSHFIIDA